MASVSAVAPSRESVALPSRRGLHRERIPSKVRRAICSGTALRTNVRSCVRDCHHTDPVDLGRLADVDFLPSSSSVPRGSPSVVSDSALACFVVIAESRSEVGDGIRVRVGGSDDE